MSAKKAESAPRPRKRPLTEGQKQWQRELALRRLEKRGESLEGYAGVFRLFPVRGWWRGIETEEVYHFWLRLLGSFRYGPGEVHLTHDVFRDGYRVGEVGLLERVEPEDMPWLGDSSPDRRPHALSFHRLPGDDFAAYVEWGEEGLRRCRFELKE